MILLTRRQFLQAAAAALGPALGRAGAATAEKVVDWLGKADAAMRAWDSGGICSHL